MLILCSVASAWAGSIKKAGLEEMVNRSGVILVGTCTSIQPSLVQAQGQSIPATRYTFRVTESIKGSVAGEYTLIQLGWPSRLQRLAKDAAATRLPLVIDGLPQYQLSQEYLLMLTQPGSLGLSSPVGWSQSAFAAEHLSDGSKAWKNGLGNQGLFEEPASRYRRYSESFRQTIDGRGREGLPYREFIDMVREIVRQGR